jgi:hypothetical protein
MGTRNYRFGTKLASVFPTITWLGASQSAPVPPHAAEKHKHAGRGLPSSRRFAQALTAAPLRPETAFRFARMVRGNLTGGCHATRSHTS